MLIELAGNRPLVAAIIAWALAQTLKVPLSLLTKRGFDLRMLVSTGGMPSSHSAFVVGLAWAIGRTYRFSSGLFAISFCFAAIVMYDAAGIRRAAGRQAEVLNQIILELHRREPVKEKHLKELLGHTPFEVIAGACLGIIIAELVVRR